MSKIVWTSFDQYPPAVHRFHFGPFTVQITPSTGEIWLVAPRVYKLYTLDRDFGLDEMKSLAEKAFQSYLRSLANSFDELLFGPTESVN